jgi:hypothetical protein
MMEADRRFAAAVDAAVGAERARVWASWFAADGRQILPGRVVTGRADIAALMEGAFADPDFHLRWAPDQAGDHWTSGRYTSERPGPGGPVRTAGRYLTVWTLTGEGWRVAVDTGAPDPETEP